MSMVCRRSGLYKKSQAIEWQATRGARSGRVAWQFFVDLAARNEVKIGFFRNLISFKKFYWVEGLKSSADFEMQKWWISGCICQSPEIRTTSSFSFTIISPTPAYTVSRFPSCFKTIIGTSCVSAVIAATIPFSAARIGVPSGADISIPSVLFFI